MRELRCEWWCPDEGGGHRSGKERAGASSPVRRKADGETAAVLLSTARSPAEVRSERQVDWEMMDVASKTAHSQHEAQGTRTLGEWGLRKSCCVCVCCSGAVQRVCFCVVTRSSRFACLICVVWGQFLTCCLSSIINMC